MVMADRRCNCHRRGWRSFLVHGRQAGKPAAAKQAPAASYGLYRPQGGHAFADTVDEDPIATVQHEAMVLANGGLLAVDGDVCTFAHDRVFEAAYALSSAAQKAREHTRIAALLLAQDARGTGNLLFEIANHIEKADPVHVPPDQRLIFTQTLCDAASAVRRSGVLLRPSAILFRRCS
jgi:hypothetical protein